MTYELHTTIDLDGAEHDCTIEYSREPYTPAQVCGPVEACHPAEGGGLVDIVLTIYHAVGAPETLDLDRVPAAERDRLEQAMHDYADECDWGAEADRADYEYDRRRDALLEGR